MVRLAELEKGFKWHANFSAQLPNGKLLVFDEVVQTALANAQTERGFGAGEQQLGNVGCF